MRVDRQYAHSVGDTHKQEDDWKEEQKSVH